MRERYRRQTDRHADGRATTHIANVDGSTKSAVIFNCVNSVYAAIYVLFILQLLEYAIIW